ncbi:MAG: hypothetical protein V1673_00175 [Candidatus Omnitrophota bacterium]
MDRIEMAKKFYTQAQRMTIGMAASVVAYGAIGYYLVQMGKAGPSILNAPIYPLVKYGALAVSVLGIFTMGQLSHRMFGAFSVQVPNAKRPPQKLFVRTVLMSAGAELPLLLGMILVFLGHQPYDFIPFAVVSLVGFAFAFPKKEQWVSWLGTDF